jgi:tetratricopeptide (TPR) repeat protein
MKLSYKISTILAVLFLAGCEANWLEEKSDRSLVVPQTIDDFQALLDNSDVMNITPALGELSCDDYYFEDKTWETLNYPSEKNFYIWKKDDLYGGENNSEWIAQYKSILYANVVLEGLNTIDKEKESERWKNTKGAALFFRAIGHYNLCETYSKPFDAATADNDLSIPLKVSTDVSQQSTRQTVREVYAQIVADLTEALPLLPEKATIQTKPSKAAVFALLSRISMNMNDFESGLEYARKCLDIDKTLIDYKTLNLASANPFPRFNTEVIFDSFLLNYAVFILKFNFADTLLVKSYEQGDLRKDAFFSKNVNNSHSFKGSYGGPPRVSYTLWGGIGKNEIYLNKAECLIRTGKIKEGLDVLYQLLESRYEKDKPIREEFSETNDALRYLFQHRRKELPFRGLRFNDLRRFNQDPNFAMVIKRNISGQQYLLPPNDARYVFPIPDNVIALTGIPQNPR